MIHGHDTNSLLRLKDFINKLGLNSIILNEQPNNGMTIIEKFEHFANKCAFALALLTPDDLQASELSTGEIYRARQNVILEMGWFMGKLGRPKVVLIHAGSVELPSDITGLVYLEFQKNISEISEMLRDELISQGLI